MLSWRSREVGMRAGILGLMFAAVIAWLWPIGFGGRMPVGGDVTQFSIGLMSVLSRALKAGRLPFWNDLWGYGFPGIGESQMGVYYPPHWCLYGLLGTEEAYTASLVLHTLWGSLGAYHAGRRFGASAAGAALGGFAWATCGFYYVHLAHHWASTTGCWMPWAWALAWAILRGEGSRRTPFLLSIVLTLQLLPGHFQLAFCTQVGIVVLAIPQIVELSGQWTEGFARIVRTLVPLCAAFPLAAAQLWPTFRLARLAGDRRDFEYLSGFAATPLHLVTFLTPGLFERSPLWRMVVWDPFHTSPEEYLGFVGVVPLFLAFAAIGTRVRRSPEVRALSMVGLVTLLLALGPYVPGFRYWCHWPGFSFFRAPSRWMLATSLALCCLAGLGFDGIAQWKRPRMAILRFVGIGIAVPACLVLAIEVGLASTERPGWPGVASLYARVLDALPWGEPSTFARIVQSARRPFEDHRVFESWARQGILNGTVPRPVFIDTRFTIYRQELVPSAFVFGLLLFLGLVGGGARRLPACLAALTFIELWSFSRERRIDFGPISPLAAQSKVLARLADLPRGSRTIDTLRNLPMAAGAGPIADYRTLDLPALGALTWLAGRLPSTIHKPESILAAIRLTGADLRIFDPSEVQRLGSSGTTWFGPLDDIDDPVLAGWLSGRDLIVRQGKEARTFRVGKVPGAVGRAWLLPLTAESEAAILGTWSGEPETVMDALKGARPLNVVATDPEHRELAFPCDSASLIVLNELADPQWQAVLLDRNGKRSATVEPAFRLQKTSGRVNRGAWQAVRIPGPGDWTLKLTYQARDVYEGLAVSGGSLILMAWLFVRGGRGPRAEEGERSS